MKYLVMCLLAVIVLGLAGCGVDVDDDIDILLGEQRQPVVRTDAYYEEQFDITVEW